MLPVVASPCPTHFPLQLHQQQWAMAEDALQQYHTENESCSVFGSRSSCRSSSRDASLEQQLRGFQATLRQLWRTAPGRALGGRRSRDDYQQPANASRPRERSHGHGGGRSAAEQRGRPGHPGSGLSGLGLRELSRCLQGSCERPQQGATPRRLIRLRWPSGRHFVPLWTSK